MGKRREETDPTFLDISIASLGLIENNLEARLCEWIDPRKKYFDAQCFLSFVQIGIKNNHEFPFF
jgi:hypothetical protein